MSVYYVIFTILALVAWLDGGLSLNSMPRKLLCFLIFLILTGFAGLRYNNIDYGNYVIMFETPWETSPDLGFSVLITLLKMFFAFPVAMFLVIAALAVGINLSCYDKYSPYVFLAILFYFVHSYLLKEYIQIRAGLACAICLYSVRYIEEKRIWRYLLTMFIAISIHFSAIIFFPLYFVGSVLKNQKYVLFILISSCILGTVYPLGQVLKLIPWVNHIERLAIYASWDDFNYKIGIFTNPTTVKQIVLCLFVYVYRERLRRVVKYFDPLFIAYVLSTCWLMLFNDFVIIGARMATFLSVGEPIFIASSLYLFTRKSRFFIVPFYIVIAYFIMILNFQTKSIESYQFYPF